MNYNEKELKQLLHQQLTVNPLNSTVRKKLKEQRNKSLALSRKNFRAFKSSKQVLASNPKLYSDTPSPLLCPYCLFGGSDLFGAFAVICDNCGEKFFFLAGGGGSLSSPIGEIYLRFEFSCLEMEEDFFQMLQEEKIIKIELFS